MQEYKFSCHRCEPGEVGDGIKQPVVVVGFEASVDHMSEKHGQFATPDKQFQVHTSFKISKGKYLIIYTLLYLCLKYFYIVYLVR